MRSRGRAALLALFLLVPALSGCLDLLTGARQAGPGEWAVEFLSDESYTDLLVEVDYISGQRPSSSAMDLLEQRSRQHLRKPGGVRVRVDDAISAGEDRWSAEEIRGLEGDRRDEHKQGSTAVLYVLYLDGQSAQGSGVVGLAYGASSFAIFKERIDELAGGSVFVSSTDVERSVVVHELGHILGLVNNGIPMCTPHEDADHPNHSDNEDSVMFWAIERNPIENFVRRFNTQPPTSFDSDDRCDMERAGGK